MRNWLSEFASNSKRPAGKFNPQELEASLLAFRSFLRLNEACTVVLSAFCFMRGRKNHVCIEELIEYLEPHLSQDKVANTVESLVVHGYFMYGSEGPFSTYYDHVYLSHTAELALKTSNKKALPKYPANDHDHIIMMIYARAVSFRNRSISLQDWSAFVAEMRELKDLPFIQHVLASKVSRKNQAMALFVGILHQIDQHRVETNTLLQLFCTTALEVSRLKKELQDAFHPLYRGALLEPLRGDHGVSRLGAHPTWAALIHGEHAMEQRVVPQSQALQLIDHKSMYKKRLFYNPDTRNKVEQLRRVLIPANLRKYVKMAHKNGEPGGIISLLSGGPGTGKTELARQLAVETGRDLLVFDVTQQRNMYYGESEKAIKQVFDDYRRICQHTSNAPILFFNEGDAVFSQRTESRGNMTQTENSIQTILLQELEIFEGIMIITTNRPQSFDAAFNRRILLHLEILDPIPEVRVELLRHLFPTLHEMEIQALANTYAFTAAQLGVFRKQWELDAIIRTKRGSLYHTLESFLNGLHEKPRLSIGFKAA
jgi:hypothetical protein